MLHLDRSTLVLDQDVLGLLEFRWTVTTLLSNLIVLLLPPPPPPPPPIPPPKDTIMTSL